MRISTRLLALAVLHACASDPSSSHDDNDDVVDEDHCGESIARFKELMFVHRSVIDNARASNADNGAWSFRHLIEQLTPPGTDPADFARAFVDQWATVTSVNGFAVATRASGSFSLTRLLDAWPTDSSGKLDLARAPFRLLAIVNRLDLSSADKPAGEGRMIFGFSHPNHPSPTLTIIFEFNLPTTGARGLSAEAWARKFHALGSLEYGEEMAAKLEELTRRFTDRGDDGAPTLSQLRSSESLFGLPWEFREFTIASSGALVQSVVSNTPDSTLDSSAELATWVNDNADVVRTGKFELPARFEGGASQSFVGAPGWKLGGAVAEDVRKGFAMNTCNGCHSPAETAVKNIFYHVTPQPVTSGDDNEASLSDFVKDVELPSREQALHSLLCPSST
jgi:hypothetical protein